MPIQYQNFDLLIERAGDEFKARVLDSPAGEAATIFHLPFPLAEVENFFLQIGHTRLIESPQMQKMRLFGEQLFESTFNGNVRDKLRESLSEVSRNREGLRIRLRIADLPELTNLPWEFMYDASLSRFLTLSIETPLVRYLDVPRDIQPLTIHPPLRILAMISSPRDFPSLNTEREWENLEEALSRLENRGLVHLTRLERPTLQALQRQLRRGEYHIFHFIGHGIFSKQYQDGQLLFEDEMRGGDRVSGRDLGILLHDHRHLRLAVLNACEGARTSVEDQFSGTAQSLMLQGLPAVIAMQFRITDIAAITLAREFYAALADGYPVDAALTEARKAIKTHGNDLEWGTPVLYMRAPNGQIFDLESMPTTGQTIKPSRALDPEQLERVERQYTEALEAYYLENWEIAQQKFQTVLDENPEHEDAAAKLEIAKRKSQLLTLHEQANTAEAAKDWEKAIEILEKLVEKDPNFENGKTRLAQLRREKQLSNLYEEAQRLTKAEKWQAVLGVFTEIDTVAPRYPDPQGLRSQAEQQLSKSKRQAELESLYKDALQALDAEEWQESIKLLRRVRGLQASYRESDSLLRRAESELEHARKASHKPKAEDKKGMTARAEWLLIGLVLAYIIARNVAGKIGDFIVSTWFTSSTNEILVTTVYMSITGLFIGLVIWGFLSRLVGSLLHREIVLLLLVSTLGETLLVDFGLLLPYRNQVWVWGILWSLIGLTKGIVIAIVLRRANPSFDRKQFITIFAGWFLGFGIGPVVSNNFRGSLMALFGQDPGYSISIYIEQFVGSLIGGWATLRQTKIRFGEIKTPEEIILATSAGFALCHLATQALVGGMNYKWIIEHSNFYIAETIFNFSFGILIGLTFLWLLVKLGAQLSRSQVRWFILAQALLVAFLMAVARFWSQRLAESWVILWSVYGLFSGFAVASILRKNDPSFTKGRFFLTIMGWMIAFPSGEILHWSLIDTMQGITEAQIANTIVFSIRTGIFGLIGSAFTIGQATISRGHRAKYSVALAGFLGFGLGNLLANIVAASMEDSIFASSLQFLIWGLIGGASLAVPSRNYKQYLLMGLLGGLGMVLGNLVSTALGDPLGIDKVITGIVLGLSIGIRTKRLTAAFVLALAATTGYLIRTSLLTEYYYPSNLSMAAPVEFTFLALTAGLMGAIIAYVWSFLNSGGSVPTAKQDVE